MRVVQVSYYRHPAALPAERVLEVWPSVLAVAGAAQTAGVDVHVVQAHHANVVGADGLVTFATDVDGAIARLRPDLLHVSGLAFGGHSRAAAKRVPGLRVLVQNRGGHAAARWRRPLIRRGLRHVHGLLFTSKAQTSLHNGSLPDGIPVFEVVDASTHFTPGSQAGARAATGLQGEPCVLWVGRLNANKDPFTALRAISLAAHELPGLQLWCCFTQAPLAAEVRAQIEGDSRLRERVHLLGAVPHHQLEQVYRSADLFLSCSHTEGSGFALIEALGCGLPAVCTDIPSFRKITANGLVARLVAPGDHEAFARAIVELQRDRVAQDSVRRHFEQRLSFEAMGRDLRAAYEAVLS